jgi:hypothetical protein
MGLGRLSKVARLSENNCRLNIRSLISKLALEEIGEENSRAGIGKTYRLYSYSAILQRRKQAGLEWVVKTKGVTFVTPDGMPIQWDRVSIPPTDSLVSAPPTDPIRGTVSVADSPTETVGGPPTETAPASSLELNLRNPSRKTSSSSLIEETARKYGLILDDDIVQRLVKNCRVGEPAATEEEIAYMLDIKINQLKGSRSIENWPALLAKSVANLFPSNELQRLRTRKARELTESREVARQVLEDPDSPEESRQWAHTVLGELSDDEEERSLKFRDG